MKKIVIKVRENVWGNWRAYYGRRAIKSFGDKYDMYGWIGMIIAKDHSIKEK